jgi:ABC-type transporter Mla subunit MlaD
MTSSSRGQYVLAQTFLTVGAAALMVVIVFALSMPKTAEPETPSLQSRIR